MESRYCWLFSIFATQSPYPIHLLKTSSWIPEESGVSGAQMGSSSSPDEEFIRSRGGVHPAQRRSSSSTVGEFIQPRGGERSQSRRVPGGKQRFLLEPMARQVLQESRQSLPREEESPLGEAVKSFRSQGIQVFQEKKKVLWERQRSPSEVKASKSSMRRRKPSGEAVKTLLSFV